MTTRLEKISTVLLTVAAMISAAVIVYRELVEPSPASTTPRKMTFEPEWRQAISVGRMQGSANAPVTLVEFGDLECPFCREFHNSVLSIRDKFQDQVAFVFVHFPLPTHRFAMPAARVLECAGLQGRFFEMLTALYAKQDSLGLKPWTGFAEDAGISGHSVFSSCVADTRAVKAIEEGVALGHRLEVRATPTLFVNGWRIGGAVPTSRITEIVEELLAGREP